MNRGARLKYIRAITQIALIVAIMCVFAQLSFYIGPVPITMQTLVIAFTGYFLGMKKGIVAVCVYLLLGAVGAPVFSAFNGGFHILIGYTGGFLWGFIPYVIFCGILKEKRLGIVLGLIGMLICHLLGVIQYSLISRVNIFASFVVVSLPFLIKDILFTILAYYLAKKVRKITKLS
jgi:biotin transport system substrate-specific component